MKLRYIILSILGSVATMLIMVCLYFHMSGKFVFFKSTHEVRRMVILSDNIAYLFLYNFDSTGRIVEPVISLPYSETELLGTHWKLMTIGGAKSPFPVYYFEKE